MKGKFIAVAETSSKRPSLRITLPKEVEEKSEDSDSEHISFYEINLIVRLRLGRLSDYYLTNRKFIVLTILLD